MGIHPMQEMKLMSITPEIAREFLKKNRGNRAVRVRVVERYAAMMAAGEWKLTHQGIAIGEDGTLLDGQHRLLGVIKSNASVSMWVITNVPGSSYPYIDGGVKRTMADALRENRRHVEVAVFFFRLAGNLGRTPSPNEVHRSILALEDVLLEMDDVGKSNQARLLSSVGGRAAAIAATLLGYNSTRHYAFMLFHQLTLGEIHGLPPIAAILVKQILTGNPIVYGSGSTMQTNVFFKLLPIFSEKNRNLKRIPVLDEDQKIFIRDAIARILFAKKQNPPTPPISAGHVGAVERPLL